MTLISISQATNVANQPLGRESCGFPVSLLLSWVPLNAQMACFTKWEAGYSYDRPATYLSALETLPNIGTDDVTVSKVIDAS